MNKRIGLILSDLLLVVGSINFISPIILYWLINGDIDRYIWIINKPFPFNYFGGGPFQVLMYSTLFILGTVLTVIALILKRIILKN